MSVFLPGLDLISLDAVHTKLPLKSPSELFPYLARNYAPALIHTADEILPRLEAALKDALQGGGVALPYVVLPRLARPFAALVTLQEGMECGAHDNKPVDVLFVLIVPERDGALNRVRLSRLSRILKNQDLCTQLRGAQTENEIYVTLMATHNWPVAA